MANATTVVAAPQRLSKLELHARLMVGWSRLIARMGRGRFADMLEISGEGVAKQLAGSMPRFEQIDRAFDEDNSILDDWLAHKRKRLVDEDAVCDTDDAALLMSRLLERLLAAQHPDSPGGRRIVAPEIMEMEDLLREVHRMTGNLLEEGARYRGLRSVA